jgi:8-oxo-dGTP pyrophosphatase MutT (NUDIX family)
VSLKPWTIRRENALADMGIFRLYERYAVSPRTGDERRIALVSTGDWVNMIPLTPAGEVVLVRQWRHGTKTFTLEIPGGLVDPGESPSEAASREVREETGYAGDPPALLGVVEPNPAFLDNRCFTYLLENCRRVGDLIQDAGEDIEVVTLPLAEIPARIAHGEIQHALVICAFFWLAQRGGLELTP